MDQGCCEVELVRSLDGRVADMRYLTINPAFERLFGIPTAAAVGRLAREVVADIQPWWRKTCDRIARARKPERFEQEATPLGRWFEVHVYPRGGDRLGLLYNDIAAL